MKPILKAYVKGSDDIEVLVKQAKEVLYDYAEAHHYQHEELDILSRKSKEKYNKNSLEKFMDINENKESVFSSISYMKGLDKEDAVENFIIIVNAWATYTLHLEDKNICEDEYLQAYINELTDQLFCIVSLYPKLAKIK